MDSETLLGSARLVDSGTLAGSGVFWMAEIRQMWPLWSRIWNSDLYELECRRVQIGRVRELCDSDLYKLECRCTQISRVRATQVRSAALLFRLCTLSLLLWWVTRCA